MPISKQGNTSSLGQMCELGVLETRENHCVHYLALGTANRSLLVNTCQVFSRIVLFARRYDPLEVLFALPTERNIYFALEIGTFNLKEILLLNELKRNFWPLYSANVVVTTVNDH